MGRGQAPFQITPISTVPNRNCCFTVAFAVYVLNLPSALSVFCTEIQPPFPFTCKPAPMHCITRKYTFPTVLRENGTTCVINQENTRVYFTADNSSAITACKTRTINLLLQSVRFSFPPPPYVLTALVPLTQAAILNQE